MEYSPSDGVVVEKNSDECTEYSILHIVKECLSDLINYIFVFNQHVKDVIIEHICPKPGDMAKMWVVLRATCMKYNSVIGKAKYINLSSIRVCAVLIGELDISAGEAKIIYRNNKNMKSAKFICGLCGDRVAGKNREKHKTNCIKIKKPVIDCNKCMMIRHPTILSTVNQWNAKKEIKCIRNCPISITDCPYCSDKYPAVVLAISHLAECGNIVDVKCNQCGEISARNKKHICIEEFRICSICEMKIFYNDPIRLSHHETKCKEYVNNIATQEISKITSIILPVYLGIYNSKIYSQLSIEDKSAFSSLTRFPESTKRASTRAQKLTVNITYCDHVMLNFVGKIRGTKVFVYKGIEGDKFALFSRHIFSVHAEVGLFKFNVKASVFFDDDGQRIIFEHTGDNTVPEHIKKLVDTTEWPILSIN